jgi:ABC-2 type transport system permease protein
MKVLDIAFKDLKRTLRTPFVLVMMFGAPLLITGLLYFAFGGLTGDDGGFGLSTIRVEVANLDRPGAQSAGFAAGELLVQFLQDQGLGNLLEVHVVADEASARAAVENQDADVALIIPPDFTAAALAPTGEAAVTLYQDPTLTIGPGIVRDLVSQFIDGFAGAKIAVGVASQGLATRGLEPDQAMMQNVAQQYAAWLESSGHQHGDGIPSTLQVQSPAGKAGAAGETGQETPSIGSVMAGMMIFFAFFMGANSAESIIREQEEGTLARLFTTPTSYTLILGGKFLTVFLTLVIQIGVLLVASALIFGIQWGQAPTIALITLGLIVVAAGFGVLLMSFVQNTRQTGPVMGGVLTVTGMLGGLFTTGIPNLPEAFDTIKLVMPQGWALEGWAQALEGATPSAVLAPLLVMLGMGAAFFALGVVRFRNRFA